MSLKVLGYVAIAEAVSFVVLLIATGFKYGVDAPRGVEIMGPVHGVLFLAFVGLAVIIGSQRKWTRQRMAVVVASAVIPIAGYVVGHRLLREAGTETA